VTEAIILAKSLCLILTIFPYLQMKKEYEKRNQIGVIYWGLVVVIMLILLKD